GVRGRLGGRRRRDRRGPCRADLHRERAHHPGRRALMTGRLERRAGYTILIVASLIAALPLAGVVVMALNSPASTSGSLSVGSATHVGNFATVWRMAGFGQSLKASAVITAA